MLNYNKKIEFSCKHLEIQRVNTKTSLFHFSWKAGNFWLHGTFRSVFLRQGDSLCSPFTTIHSPLSTCFPHESHLSETWGLQIWELWLGILQHLFTHSTNKLNVRKIKRLNTLSRALQLFRSWPMLTSSWGLKVCKYLLSIYYVPVTGVSTGDTEVNKIAIVNALRTQSNMTSEGLTH